MATYPPTTDQSQKIRHIRLQLKNDGHLEWHCSECGWSIPVFDPHKTSVAPMRPIDEFTEHSCLLCKAPAPRRSKA